METLYEGRLKSMETLYEGRLKDKDQEVEFLHAESKDAVGALKDVALKDNVKGRKWSEYNSSFYFCLPKISRRHYHTFRSMA